VNCGRGINFFKASSVLHTVIAGLDPAIHRFLKKMDARLKAGHDD
jgi:hypothetical protein